MSEPLAAPRWVTRIDRVALPILLIVAAVLRLPSLATRGTWDGDQGHDMLVLQALVQDGVVPLLGPPTSIGSVHHGAWYYLLLSPAAALTGGDDPVAIVALIALAGIAAVGVVWWLARDIAGPAAGLAAGLLVAVSTAAVDESTFIWNPNLIALSSSVALAGAWRAWSGGRRAWSGGRRAWWLVAAVGLAVTMQCHILGVALLPIIGAPFVLDARRRDLGRTLLGVIAVFVLAYLPLAVNELTTGGSEIEAALAYLGAGGGGEGPALPIRFVIVGLRVIGWPLVGLITTAFLPTLLATGLVVAVIGWCWRRADEVGWAVRWLGLGLLWTTAFLAVAAPSLATVVVGLPNDHYHAFADPLVFLLVGIGFAVALGGTRMVAGAATVGLAALVIWNVATLPPAVHPDGGWPAAEIAGDRVIAALDQAGVGREDVVALRSLPDFKSTEAVAYPLVRAGQALVAATPHGVAPGSQPDPGASSDAFAALVLLCDDLFAESIGAPCGGPAESAVAPDDGSDAVWGPLVDRFEAHPGRWISIYGPVP